VLTRPRAQAVVIGASAGGFAALERLLPALPPGYPLPVLVVQHLHRLQDRPLRSGLASRCEVYAPNFGFGSKSVMHADHSLLIRRGHFLRENR